MTGELHNIDFTGRLFNVLNEWVDVPDGAKMMLYLHLAILQNLWLDYVESIWTAMCGILLLVRQVSLFRLCINDSRCQTKISSPEELNRKITHIKMYQLLGIEKLADIYMLAVLNMILMKDGSSNIIHGDSLTEFEGNYEQGEYNGNPFPANVFY